MRTWLDATNDSIQDRIPPTHDLLTWLVEHVVSIHNRTAIGEDGRTSMERTRGRRGKDHMVEFGESILYIPLRGDLSDRRIAKVELEPRFLDGIFLGLTHRSDEAIVWGG